MKGELILMVNYLPEGNVVVNIDFCVLEHQEEAFLKLIYYLIDNSLKEEGNISYRVFREERAKNQYAIIEHWESQDALNVHLGMPHTQYFNDNIEKYVYKQPNRIELVRDNDSLE